MLIELGNALIETKSPPQDEPEDLQSFGINP
jgi:hypothetical protein